MHFTRMTKWTLATVTLACIAVAACNNQSSSKSGGMKGGDQGSSGKSGEPMRAPDKMGGTATQTNTTKTTAKPAPTPPAHTPEPVAAKPTESIQQVSTAKPAEPPPASETPEQELEKKRGQAEDMIYATIRVKMEEAIAERSKLLKEGRPPADERVRQLEGTIMRARSLLVENGEIVADVEPPIVEVQK